MGPLAGVKVVEFAGIGPTPFAGMLLADLGAEVLRIDRPAPPDSPAPDATGDILGRGRASLVLDLKTEAGITDALSAVECADILIEGFRPGVMERLGLGPDTCLTRKPALVYGRMTGWGQDGPLSKTAGHDINYIALSGALWSMGDTASRPTPPMNLLGDFGAGSTFLVMGVLAALLRARETGQGDVVDAAICDGVNTLMAFVRGLHARDDWVYQRGANRLDGGAPYYDVYECADGKWVTLGALEPQFFDTFVRKVGLEPADFRDRKDPARWSAHKAQFAALFATRTRDEWDALLADTDACVSPVLDPLEALDHPHNKARALNDDSAGFAQPRPSPRFRHADPELPPAAPARGEGGRAKLEQWRKTTRLGDWVRSA